MTIGVVLLEVYEVTDAVSIATRGISKESESETVSVFDSRVAMVGRLWACFLRKTSKGLETMCVCLVCSGELKRGVEDSDSSGYFSFCFPCCLAFSISHNLCKSSIGLFVGGGKGLLAAMAAKDNVEPNGAVWGGKEEDGMENTDLGLNLFFSNILIYLLSFSFSGVMSSR